MRSTVVAAAAFASVLALASAAAAQGGLGEACTVGTECMSSFCADGVCCDAPCGDAVDDCLACTSAAGGSANGMCTVRAAGSACTDATCYTPSTCDGLFAFCYSTPACIPGSDGGTSMIDSGMTTPDAGTSMLDAGTADGD